jgi:hypothetical protein
MWLAVLLSVLCIAAHIYVFVKVMQLYRQSADAWGDDVLYRWQVHGLLLDRLLPVLAPAAMLCVVFVFLLLQGTCRVWGPWASIVFEQNQTGRRLLGQVVGFVAGLAVLPFVWVSMCVSLTCGMGNAEDADEVHLLAMHVLGNKDRVERAQVPRMATGHNVDNPKAWRRMHAWLYVLQCVEAVPSFVVQIIVWGRIARTCLVVTKFEKVSLGFSAGNLLLIFLLKVCLNHSWSTFIKSVAGDVCCCCANRQPSSQRSGGNVQLADLGVARQSQLV